MNLWNYKAMWKLSANLTCFHEPHIWTERVLEDVLLLKCCSRDKQEFSVKAAVHKFSLFVAISVWKPGTSLCLQM